VTLAVKAMIRLIRELKLAGPQMADNLLLFSNLNSLPQKENCHLVKIAGGDMAVQASVRKCGPNI
jgi:hypothetical protein